MHLGTFSVSLAVKDISKSKEFYEKLNFEVVGGDEKQNWLIMRNGTNTIGLFQGMFESNILTFNPGWDSECNTLEKFSDVRELHNDLKTKGIDFMSESLNSESGPGSFSILDPDGNAILIDQHV